MIPLGTAFASQVSETFSSRTYWDSGTALWNQARGLLTPALVIRNWNDGSNRTSDFDIGDGRHGAFNSTTWSQIADSVDTGTNTIYLNTDEEFYFTTFDLPASWTLEGVGSKPLTIYVQGDMTVDGTIQCSGKAGGNSTGTMAGALAGTGGEGRCGGYAGGSGGARYTGGSTGDGHMGSSATVGTISAGAAGTTTGAGSGSGGGGGGAWSSFNIPNTASTAGLSGTAGARGSNDVDSDWTYVQGAAGGGGGSGSSTEAGAGGGAGGGVLIIHVGGNFTAGTTGLLLANGGDGGVSPSDGGGGGAGGGGSIQLWVAENLTLNGPGNNQISAASGNIGNTASGGDGGSGWAGRIWIGVVGAKFSNPLGATNDPSTDLISEGTPEYVTSAVMAISKPLDTLSTLPYFSSAAFSTTGTATDIQLEVAGSNDAFASDDTGWVSDSNVALIDNKRYVRFRLTLTNSNASTPTTVDSVSIDFTKGEKKEFEFQASGCGWMQNQKPSGMGMILILLALPLGLALVLKAKAQST